MAGGHSARAIARELGLARNTVFRYLNSPEAMLPKPRPPRGPKLDPYTEHIDRRMAEGLENCVVLLRELWTRACYVELVRRPDTAAFIQCHATPSSTWAAFPSAASTTTPRW